MDDLTQVNGSWRVRSILRDICPGKPTMDQRHASRSSLSAAKTSFVLIHRYLYVYWMATFCSPWHQSSTPIKSRPWADKETFPGGHPWKPKAGQWCYQQCCRTVDWLLNFCQSWFGRRGQSRRSSSGTRSLETPGLCSDGLCLVRRNLYLVIPESCLVQSITRSS